MKITVILAALFITLGTLGLVYEGFNYTRDTHNASMGPMHFSIEDRKYVNIPVWAGVALIALGGGLLAWKRKS